MNVRDVTTSIQDEQRPEISTNVFSPFEIDLESTNHSAIARFTCYQHNAIRTRNIFKAGSC